MSTTGKTNFMIIATFKCERQSQDLRMGHERFEEVNSFKHLGNYY